jgi:hypothetical protein
MYVGKIHIFSQKMKINIINNVLRLKKVIKPCVFFVHNVELNYATYFSILQHLPYEQVQNLYFVITKYL